MTVIVSSPEEPLPFRVRLVELAIFFWLNLRACEYLVIREVFFGGVKLR
jgi:hypothetical protein